MVIVVIATWHVARVEMLDLLQEASLLEIPRHRDDRSSSSTKVAATPYCKVPVLLSLPLDSYFGEVNGPISTRGFTSSS